MKPACKENESSPIIREICGILYIALGLFVFVSLYWPEAAGQVGEWLISILLGNIIGAGIYILPYFFFLLGLVFMFGKTITSPRVQGAGLSLIFIAAITFWDIFTTSQSTSFSLRDIIVGGGFIGRVCNYLLHWFGIAGAYIVLFSVIVIGLMLSSSFSWQRFREHMQEQLQEKRKDDKKSNEKEKPRFKPFIDPSGDEDIIKPVKVTTEKTDIRAKGRAKRLEALGNPEKEDSLLTGLDLAQQVEYPDGYKLPPLSLLEKPVENTAGSGRSQKDDINTLESTLASFNVEARVVDVSYGPSITRYELEPGHGVRINKIANLADDISLSLASSGVRIEAPVPGKSVVGVEIPNKEIQMVTMYEIVTSRQFQQSTDSLLCALGKDVAGKPIMFDLAKMPHVLIAGATGAGKSVCVNSIITSIIMRNRPDEVKFIMIDPKKVELTLYNGIPHLLTPVVTDPKLAAVTLKTWAIKEMERRYNEFSRIGVKNIAGYNSYIEEIHKTAERGTRKAELKEKAAVSSPSDSSKAENGSADVSNFKKLPYIVVIIDELADLMMVASNDVESSIIRLAQLARATGIHLVIATQRPSVNVITGLIKANVPSRIAFAVSSQIDARTILDNMGAEKLLGRGDMLYSPVGMFKPMRLQGVFLSDKELNRIISHVKKQSKPEYNEELEKIEEIAFEKAKEDNNDQDPLYEEAKQILKEQKKPSISFLQRRLRIGYNRAARIFEELEEAGEIFREVEA
ncbi:MAG: DNA translocase FtsK 4TM domain-containing protein [Candidatus Margulisiibacteriota bacterium]